MPSAVVTGATGFIGSHLVDALLDRGWRVSVTLRPTSPTRWIEGKAVDRLVGGISPAAPLPACDVLFHVAGVIRADTYPDYLSGNRDLAIQVFDASRAGRFVHVSSLAAAGPGEQVDEAMPCRPISLYGRSKWEGEREIWERRVRTPVTILRPPVVYGPRDLGLLDMYRIIARGIRPEIGGRKMISIVHVRDLVEGILRAAQAPEGANQVFYLANEEVVEISRVLSVIQRALGSRALRVVVPDRVVRFLGAAVEDGARLAGKRVMFGRDKALEMTQKAWCCSPGKAERLLGWKSTLPLSQGVEETANWYRAHGFL